MCNFFADVISTDGSTKVLSYPIKHESGIVMKKKSSTIDVPNDNSGKGDDNFRRFEYWDIGPYFLDVGDCHLLSTFHMTIKGMTVTEVKMINAFVCSPIYGRLW